MVKRLSSFLRSCWTNLVAPPVLWGAEAAVGAAALVWRARATVIDVAGALLVAVFVAGLVPRGGLLVMGVWLMVQAFVVERRTAGRRAGRGEGR